MPEQEAPVTNTAMRIGTSHLVPPPQGSQAMPPVSVARPPHPPTAAISLQTQVSAPTVIGTASSADVLKIMTPAPASSQGTAPAAATPLVSHAQVQSSATPHGSQQRRTPGNSSVEQRACNCKNSRCLKLYCECFASGRYCNACNCSNCMNNKDHEQARSKAIEAILERNPNAFRPKIQIQQVCIALMETDVWACPCVCLTLSSGANCRSVSYCCAAQMLVCSCYAAIGVLRQIIACRGRTVQQQHMSQDTARVARVESQIV